MRAQPGTQERPKAFYRIDMHFMKTIAILIACIFARRMIDRLVLVAPSFQSRIDVVLIGKNQASLLDGLFEEWLDCVLLNIRKHVQHDLSVALDHAQDRRFFPCQRAPSGLTLQTSAATWTPQLSHDFGMAFVTGDNIHLITFNLTAQLNRLFLTAIPSRNCVVMTWTSSGSKSSSAAIC